MAYYKVREHFYPQRATGSILSPGAIAELSDEEAKRIGHMIEEITIEEPTHVTTRNRKSKSPVSTSGTEDGDN